MQNWIQNIYQHILFIYMRVYKLYVCKMDYIFKSIHIINFDRLKSFYFCDISTIT